MKKTKLTRSLLAACSIVALSAVMYGCSGPSQGDLDAANEATAAAVAEAKDNADAAVAAKVEADAAAEVARLAQEEADAAADKARLAQVAAEDQSALDAQAKIDADAAAAKAEEDARIAQEAADAAQMVADDAIKAQMDAEAERDAAQAERDTAKMELEENQQQAQDEEDADDIAKLKRLHRGLSNDDGDVAEGFDTPPAIKAKHGEPATSGAETEAGTAIEGDDEIAGFSGTQLEGSDDADAYMNTLTVYTDIDETTGIPFGQMYDASDGKLDFIADPPEESGDEDLNENKNIESDHFVNVNFRIHDFNADGPDPDSDPDHVAYEGTYNGAEGVYRCSEGQGTPAVSTCRSTRNGDDSLTLSIGWTFTPNPDAMVQVTDGIYMYFGWWLRENLNAPADTGGLSVQTFAGVNDTNDEDGVRAPSADITVLIGEATFDGAAVGKFAIYDPAIPGGDAVAGGHFTADATLTAKFGAENEPGSISGTIDNFLLGGDAPEDAWSVALMSTELLDVAAVDGTEDANGDRTTELWHFTTVNDADIPAVENVSPAIVRADRGTQWSIDTRKADRAGNWGGTFYDSADADADGANEDLLTADRNDGTPGYAVGEFSAEYGTIGRMLGAFGTSNSEADRDPQ